MITVILYVLLGITAGTLSGLIGIGGGVIIVPALVFVFGLSQHAAQGTTLALLVPPIGISVPGPTGSRAMWTSASPLSSASGSCLAACWGHGSPLSCQTCCWGGSSVGRRC